MAEIIDGSKKSNLNRAAEVIRSEGLVAFPTETVYGLGANAFSVTAINEIFRVKDRPFNDPLIVHIGNMQQLREVIEGFSEIEKMIANAFWPGPLTIVTRKNKKIPSEVTSGLEFVGVRMPRNPIALELLRLSDVPIAAPSANRFQGISPTTAQAVNEELGDRISLILDGGPCEVGVESTVVKFDKNLYILRPGGISREQLENVTNLKVTLNKTENSKKESPGAMDFHYAPRTPLLVIDSKSLEEVLGKCAWKSSQMAAVVFEKKDEKKAIEIGFKKILKLSRTEDLDESAKNFFQTLRNLDKEKLRGIIVFRCTDHGVGLALLDRMHKAQHGFENI